MKTFNELKKIYIGEGLSIIEFILFAELYCLIDDSVIYWDIETIMIFVGWAMFNVVVTYIGWTLFKGIKNDVEDIVKEKEKTKA